MTDYKLLSKTFKLLADVNRLKIVEALTEECQSVNEITKRAGISQPLASHHLKNLKESGIARSEKRGTSNYY